MKHLGSRFKGLLLSLILLCLFIFLFSLLVPTRISSNKILFSNADSIVNKLADVSTYKHWYAPIAQDTNLAPMYSKNTKGVGAYIQYGDNKLTITNVTKNEVLFEVENKTGAKIKSGFEIINTTNIDTNFVKWYFVTANKYLPWQRFRSIALEKIMKPEMRKSLDDFGHYLNNGAAEDGLAINDDFCDDSLIATKNITLDTTNNGINLFKEALAFKSQLIANGFAEAEISKSFYITQGNPKSFIAFGVTKKSASNINIIAIPNTVKQLDLLLNNKSGSTTNTMLALEKFAANKNYKIWNNLKLIKYINWQYATQNQKPNLKYLLFYQ